MFTFISMVLIGTTALIIGDLIADIYKMFIKPMVQLFIAIFNAIGRIGSNYSKELPLKSNDQDLNIGKSIHQMVKDNQQLENSSRNSKIYGDEDSQNYKYIPNYNPLRPDRGFYRKASLSDPDFQQFIASCNRYVRGEDEKSQTRKELIKEYHQKPIIRKEPKPIDPETKYKRAKVTEFRKQLKKYSYRDVNIDDYINDILTHDEMDRYAAEMGDYTDDEILSNFGCYLMQIMHVYADYGYITSKMASYALDIPLRYAYRFVKYLFGKELPESKSTININLLADIYTRIGYKARGNSCIEQNCDIAE